MSVGRRVAVIGAGWAGLAAAVELTDREIAVDVYEASRTLGGRARTLTWGRREIDNGQHLLIGAYTETLRLMRKVGANPDQVLLRLPLTLWYPGEFHLRAPRLPAPLHTGFALAFAQGLDWREKLAALRLMAWLRKQSFRIAPDLTVEQWLQRHQVPPRQRRLLWEPLCISALNTPAERASAQIMANVLRDSLASSRTASDMLIPRKPLSDCFPEPAANWLTARGARIFREARVAALRREGLFWWVNCECYDQVILAVAPYHLADVAPTLAASVTHLEHEPIVTTYFDFDQRPSLAAPMLGIDYGIAQWIFDHSHWQPDDLSIAAVISARGRHTEMPREAFEANVLQDIKRLAALPAPTRTLTVIEKRATFSCQPGLARPHPTTDQNGLWLAGDYVANDYPATIEGATRSGTTAARLVAQTI